MYHPRIVSPSEWQAEYAKLLAREKDITRARDALAAERRRMPATAVEKDYTFIGPEGECGLPDLFDGRRQLIVYHHMLKPADPSPCEGCCMFVDNIGHQAHLHARDTNLVLVSRAPIDEIQAFRGRMGWTLPWYATTDSFNADFDVAGGGFGLNVFLRDDAGIYRTYFTTNRGAESLGNVWSFLDITPLGRQETWEDSPEGVPQSAPYEWWRLHDEY